MEGTALAAIVFLSGDIVTLHPQSQPNGGSGAVTPSTQAMATL